MANRVTAQYFDEGANRLHVVKFETHANDVCEGLWKQALGDMA